MTHSSVYIEEITSVGIPSVVRAKDSIQTNFHPWSNASSAITTSHQIFSQG
jgi:hypothetical protein